MFIGLDQPVLPPAMPPAPATVVVERQAPQPIKVWEWNQGGQIRQKVSQELPFTAPSSLLDQGVRNWLESTTKASPVPFEPQPFPSDAKRVVYRQALGGVLFGPQGPRVDDVIQGAAGDCYALATAGSLAEQQPEVLLSMFEKAQTGDDAWWVRLYYHDEVTGQPRAERILVYATFPMTAGVNSPLYADFARTPDGSPILWVSLFEKAYAKFNTLHPGEVKSMPGYQGIGSGSLPFRAYFHLTGREQPGFEFDGVKFKANQAQVGARLSQKRAEEKILHDQLWKVLSMVKRGHIVTAGSKTGENLPGLPGGHAYSVLGVREGAGGQRQVLLDNPWGCYTPDHPKPVPGPAAGKFWLSLEDFRKFFFHISAQMPNQQTNKPTNIPLF
jgi:hypothetical protein